jgi:hypothetical protein
MRKLYLAVIFLLVFSTSPQAQDLTAQINKAELLI